MLLDDELYRTLFVALDEGIVVHDADGTVIACNASAERLLGRDAEELVGRNPRDGGWQGLREDGTAMAIEEHPALVVLRSGRPVRGAVAATRRPDGEVCWLSGNAVPIPALDGDGLRAVVVSFTDVTRRREAELARDEAERQLAAARDEAVQAAEAKSSFLATMSHEIRTPLNGVIGAVDLLLAGDLDEDQRELVRVLRESAECLLAISDDVLDLSKIDADRLEPDPVDFALRELVEGVVELLAPTARRKGVAVCSELDDALPALVHGEARWLRQVLVNLVGNAVKFTERGTVEVGARPVGGSASARVRFAVRDTGIGIAADDFERLFEPFTQVDGTSTRRYGGTGLGLAISQRLVESMGGRIAVESAPGRGSEFSFEVELAPAAAAAPPAAEPPNGAATPRPTRGRVLVAEDNEVNRALLVRQLALLGIQADTVASGAGVAAAVADGDYLAVLMDRHMPDVDGLAACAAVRALGTPDAHVPIVAVTASASEEDRRACIAAGMDGFLGKPVTIASLRAALAPWIEAPPPPAGRERRRVARPRTALDGVLLDELAAAIGDGELRRIGSLYLDAVARSRGELSRAIEGRDLELLATVAHRLRGSSATFGAVTVGELSERLEDAARAGEMATALALARGVERELPDVASELGARLSPSAQLPAPTG